jgi:integrase
MSIRERKGVKGTSYLVRVRLPDGRDVGHTWPTPELAKKEETELRADIGRGRAVFADRRTTLGEFAQAWLAGHTGRASTLATITGRIELQVLPALGHRTLASLRPSELQRWAKRLGDELAPETVKGVVGLLRQILRAAVRDGLIASNPADGLRLPRAEKERVVPLSVEQVEALRRAMPPRYAAAVILAAGSGLRPGEVFGLTVDKVDFLRRTVKVDQQMVSGIAGQKPALAPPKTPRSRRLVPVPALVVEALSAHLAAFPAGPDGLIFTSEWGTPVAKRAKLPETANGWHQLRHFYASVLIRAGESVRVVSERLGHADAAMTLNTYSHLWPDDDDRTRSAVEAAFGGVGASTEAATAT